MKILLLRHGATAGNLEKRFIGVTDEPLCNRGRNDLSAIRSGIDASDEKKSELTTLLNEIHALGTEIFVSPLSRCRESAKIFFPGAKQIVCENFRECNFGILENRTHEELLDDDRYVRFIESTDNESFPGGERIDGFLKRCAVCFKDLVFEYMEESDAATYLGGEKIFVAVVHGGTVMGIMNAFSEDRESVPYYKWSPENGHGFLADLEVANGNIDIRNAKRV